MPAPVLAFARPLPPQKPKPVLRTLAQKIADPRLTADERATLEMFTDRILWHHDREED